MCFTGWALTVKPVHYQEVTWLDVLDEKCLWGEVPESRRALEYVLLNFTGI